MVLDAISVRPISHPQEVWVDVHAWIESALDHPMSLISAADVHHALVENRMKLWGIYSGAKIVGAAVTEIVSGSRGRGLLIIALGGVGLKEWLGDFCKTIESFGRDEKCRFVAEMGRIGWTRVLPSYGWNDGPSMMLKVL